jgi:hypothetical protein
LGFGHQEKLEMHRLELLALPNPHFDEGGQQPSQWLCFEADGIDKLARELAPKHTHVRLGDLAAAISPWLHALTKRADARGNQQELHLKAFAQAYTLYSLLPTLHALTEHLPESSDRLLSGIKQQLEGMETAGIPIQVLQLQESLEAESMDGKPRDYTEILQNLCDWEQQLQTLLVPLIQTEDPESRSQ